MILSRLSYDALLAMMQVPNRQLRSIIRRQYHANSTIILRDRQRADDFLAHLRNNPYSPESNFRHIEFHKNTNTFREEIMIYIIYRMWSLETVHFVRILWDDLRPCLYNIWHDSQNAIQSISADPLPWGLEQFHYWDNCYCHRASLQRLHMPQLLGYPIATYNGLQRLSKFPNLRSLTLPFAVYVVFNSILASAPQLEELELVGPRGPMLKFDVLTVRGRRSQLPVVRNSALSNFRFSVSLISVELMDFISQHLLQLGNITFIGETDNHAAVNTMLLDSPVIVRITQFAIQDHSQVDLILPGTVSCFPRVENSTIARCNVQTPILDFGQLRMDILHLDTDFIGTGEAAIIVETAVCRAMYYRLADRFIAVNQLPVGVYILLVSADGLLNLHLFSGTRRNYHQYFHIDFNAWIKCCLLDLHTLWFALQKREVERLKVN